MPLDGLRAWVAEVERKLGKRTRVFLALCVISIGIAGAAVYLAIDARESSVSESDVQELQRELEARIDEGATTTPGLGATPEPATPEGETAPEEETAPAPRAPGSGANRGSGSESGLGSSNGSGAGGGADSADQLKDLLDQARKQAE
jgi:hypothetical protein